MRFSEKLLQASGLTVVARRLSEIIFAANALADDASEVKAKLTEISAYGRIPPYIKPEKIIKQAKRTISESIMDRRERMRRERHPVLVQPDNFGCATCLTMSMMGGKAILDNDGRSRTDSAEGGLQISFWRRYEAENYFITPDLLRRYALNHYGNENLFANVVEQEIQAVLDNLISEEVFGGDVVDFDIWKDSPGEAARLVWESKTERMKLSSFAEEFFRRLGAKLQRPMLMRKGELHRLVQLVDVQEHLE